MVKKLTNEEIKERIFELVGDEYTKLDNSYINANTKFKIKHNTCGHEYGVSWGSFQRGVRCPKCAGRYKYTDSEMSELISEITNGEYTKLSEYKNNKAKFKIKHNKCGCEYEVNWNNFQKGHRCPKCNQSKGERFIEDYLTNQGISFATQVRFVDCRHKLPLPFDFAILDDNKRIIFLVEYDGIQHHKQNDFFGGEEALQQTQLRDSIKNQYCKEHNLHLLRIKYNENIEEKLSLFITQETRKVKV